MCLYLLDPFEPAGPMKKEVGRGPAGGRGLRILPIVVKITPHCPRTPDYPLLQMTTTEFILPPIQKHNE